MQPTPSNPDGPRHPASDEPQEDPLAAFRRIAREADFTTPRESDPDLPSTRYLPLATEL